MKAIFTLFSSLLLSMTLLAADSRFSSSVMVKLNEQADIRVVLDGKSFDPAGNAMIIGNVQPGRHQVKVYRESRTGFRNSSFRYELVYDQNIQLRGNTQLLIALDKNGRVQLTETRVQQKDNRFNDRSSRYYDFNRDGQFGGYDDRIVYNPAMSDREFDRVLQSISKEWLESNKLKSATHIVKSNNVTTDQVKELMRLFQFENNKLEVARQAYTNVVDKWNFREVLTLLSFQESRRELERVMR